jgi:geranylgeranyl pyrophosphate synthase
MSSNSREVPLGVPQTPDTSQLPKAISASAKLVDATLDAVLPQPAGRQARVQEAMRYAIMAGGKRLRPFLVLHSARLFGVDDSRSLRVGRRSSRCTPTASCMTICPAWTTMICAAGAHHPYRL